MPKEVRDLRFKDRFVTIVSPPIPCFFETGNVIVFGGGWGKDKYLAQFHYERTFQQHSWTDIICPVYLTEIQVNLLKLLCYPEHRPHLKHKIIEHLGPLFDEIGYKFAFETVREYVIGPGVPAYYRYRRAMC